MTQFYRLLASCLAMACALASCGGVTDTSPTEPPAPPLPAPGWSRVTESTPWGTRDAGATVVHRGEIWLLGGWSYANGVASVLTDAWVSSDGVNWRVLSPPWTYGMYPMAASHQGQVLYMGGLRNSRQPDEAISSEIWSSSDGQDWTRRVASAEWEPRIGATLVPHQGDLWILGGKVRNSGDPTTFRNDVWRSTDGIHWTEVLRQAPWPARAFHCSVSHGGRLWVIGGGDWDAGIGRSDVWSSTDGVQWTRHLDAPWEGRIWHSCQAYAGRVWLFGGRLFNPIRTVDEIWSTADGDLWLADAPLARPGPRHAAYSVVHASRIWLLGGSADGYLQPDVWQFYAP